MSEWMVPVKSSQNMCNMIWHNLTKEEQDRCKWRGKGRELWVPFDLERRVYEISLEIVTKHLQRDSERLRRWINWLTEGIKELERYWVPN